MRINSIETSLHGELPYIGLPCIILRLSECNLKCVYCDTNFEFKYERSVVEVLNILHRYNLKSVLITGGEPLLQKEEVLDLIERLGVTYKTVLETNGSILIPDFNLMQRVTVVLDIKLHDNLKHFDIRNLKRIQPGDIFKLVFWDKESFSLGYDFVLKNSGTPWCTNWVFSPTYELVMSQHLNYYTEKIINLSKKIKHQNVQFQIQLHKILNIL